MQKQTSSSSRRNMQHPVSFKSSVLNRAPNSKVKLTSDATPIKSRLSTSNITTPTRQHQSVFAKALSHTPGSIEKQQFVLNPKKSLQPSSTIFKTVDITDAVEYSDQAHYRGLDSKPSMLKSNSKGKLLFKVNN